ncbi:ribonuclease P protein component [Niastella yeongjuensis]|uniref:Ribonuclease P protein component n=1 Tax=Niastella yeongjuensis TaxID=354355 RepID=A0A1V9EX33_9BACT|nr:ribonuclease P protein component [Niastella yeongjuensis]OQP50686.1 ribonuclease P protein component [Niastella yeongjuensis]SEN22882.1 ribonuclease P protein component [Niastella yeongjuensis]
MAKQFTLNKADRLKRRKVIEQLFSEGRAVAAFPIRVQYKMVDQLTVPLQAGFSVSSRNFKRAVDRNRIKRLMREAYRLQKLPLEQALQTKEQQLALFLIYTGKDLPLYALVKEKVEVVLKKLLQTVNGVK